MAFYTSMSELTKIKVKDYMSIEHSPGEEVPNSGIYKCTMCKREITSNKGDPFPPQNNHSHTNAKWKLNIQTNTQGLDI